MTVKQIIAFPITGLCSILGANEKVKLISDNCSPGFDFTEIGKIQIDKIEISIETLKKAKRVD